MANQLEDDGNTVNEATLQSEIQSKAQVKAGDHGASVGEASEIFSLPEGHIPSYDKPAPSRTPRRTVKKGTRFITRTSETTADIPENTIDIEPEKLVDYGQVGDSRGLPSFSAAGPGKSVSGYDWYEDLRSAPGSPKLGLTCDVPGSGYSHGEGGSVGTHFMSNAKDNPFVSTPYVLCDHHFKLKQIQHAADPDIRFTPIRPQDIEKHKAKVQARMVDSARGAFESTLYTGGNSIVLPTDAPKPPKAVTLPSSDLLWAQETEGPAAGVRGASLATHLNEVNKRRSNFQKEDLLNRALENLRSSGKFNEEEHDAHMEQYHSADSKEPYCPICSEIYTRTTESAAQVAPKPQGYAAYVGFNLKPKNSAGVLRIPGWPSDSPAPDMRNKIGVEDTTTTKRVGQNLPKQTQTNESVPYGDLQSWTEHVLPAHMVVDDPYTGRRAATPLEKFAEERITKQIGEQNQAVSNVEELTAQRLRDIEAFKRMSPREQIEHRRKHLTEFQEGQGPKELE